MADPAAQRSVGIAPERFAGRLPADDARFALAPMEVARAAPDGHTLLALDNSYATLPYLFSQLPFDYAKAFRLISISAFAPLLLGAKRDAPFADLRALSAAAAARAQHMQGATDHPPVVYPIRARAAFRMLWLDHRPSSSLSRSARVA